MRSILVLAMKDLRLLARDRMALFWVVGFPLLMAFMFGAMFGGGGGGKGDGDRDGEGPGKIPVAVVDAENSAESKAFAARFEGMKELEAHATADVEAAKRDVLSGEVAAYVLLQGDFAGPGMFGGKPPRVQVGFAPSRRAESQMLRGIVMETAAEKMQEAMGGGSGGPRMTPALVDVVEVSARKSPRAMPATNWEITFPSSILWGLIGAAATFAISLVTERQSGTFYRLKTAPITTAQLLAGKGLACFLVCALVLTVLLSIAILFMGVRVQNPAGLVLAATCTALCFTGLMMLMATLGKTEQSASGMGWGIMTIMSMLGGGMFPLFLMPPWMQTASNVSPVKWGILAIEGGIWRGFTMADFAKPCGVLLGVGAAGFVLGSTILAKRDR